jgi:hypothetical protein
MKYLITEKQLKTLRKYMKTFINEDMKMITPDERIKSKGSTYGHTKSKYEFAPENLSDEEAEKSLRKKFRDYPTWTFEILKDPETQRV